MEDIIFTIGIAILFIALLYGVYKLIDKFISLPLGPKPGCPNCGSKNWKIENIAIGAYVPRAYCENCGHKGNVEIGSKYDKQKFGGMF
jgi:hypothetical protein